MRPLRCDMKTPLDKHHGISCAIAFRPHRNGKEKRAAPADLAFDPDATAVHLHEPLRDAEAEPCSPELARDCRVDLTELREHILHLFLRNADAGIRDAVDEFAVHEFHADLDPTLLGELDGVAGEIHQALCKTSVVAISDR